MTYIDYLNDFNQWLEEDSPTNNVIVLYYAMLNMFNRRGWPRWAGVDTQRLMAMVRTTSNNTAYRARDALVKAGFLAYKPGRKGRVSEYSLLKYYPQKCTENSTECGIESSIESGTECGTENGTPNKTKTKTKNSTSIPLTGARSTARANARFVPPSVEEVDDYCQEKGYSVSPDAFIAFYEANGWKVGKNPMKDWKAAVRTWAFREDGVKKQKQNVSLDDMDRMVQAAQWAAGQRGEK